jgi:hypothetical protein
VVAFLTAFMAPWLGIFLFNLPSGFGGALAQERGLTLAITLVLTPLMSAWFTAILVQYHRPRRVLTPRTASLVPSTIGGFIAGIGAVLATAILLLVGTGPFADGTITAVASAFATSLTLLLSKKIQPGRCMICSYDLCSSLEFGRCPECGTAFA